MAAPSMRPAHFGTAFAPPLHIQAEGPTDPSNTTLATNFVVSIIGASSGIGAAIPLAYAKAGCSNFMLAARRETALYDTARSVLRIRPTAKIVCQACDISKHEDVEELAEATKTAFGGLDVCIVAAGVSAPLIEDVETGKKRWPRGVTEGSVESFKQAMDVNAMGLYFAARYMVPLLEETKDGAQAFIGISSAAAHFTSSDYVPISYSLSKLAAARLIEQIHEAHSKNGISAFALHPGGVATEGMGSALPDEFNMANLTDDVGLCGAICVWLTKERRAWLSGRWLSSKWDVDQLERMKEEIMTADKLKFRMVV